MRGANREGGRPPSLSGGLSGLTPGCGGCAVIQAARSCSQLGLQLLGKGRPRWAVLSLRHWAGGPSLIAHWGPLSLRNLCRPLTGSTWEVLRLHSLLRGTEKETLASKSAATGRTPGNKHGTSILFPLEVALFLFLTLFTLVSRPQTANPFSPH